MPENDTLNDGILDNAETAKDSAAEVEEAASAVEEAEEKAAPVPAVEPEPAVKPAPAAEPEPAAKPVPVSASGGSALEKIPAAGWLGIAIAALIIGLLIGMFALGGGSSAGNGSLSGKTSVSESELDKAIGSYSFNGKSADISIRDVILQQGSLDSAKGADGNYALPSADSVMSVARNMIILAEAQNRGISATDEEVAAYAEETLGTSDYASIASSYSMDESAVVDLLTNSCVMGKLRDEVGGAEQDAVIPDAPPEPTASADLDEDATEEEIAEAREAASKEASPEYAEYIIQLAGDEWDASAGTWASQDGPYATALAGYEITEDGASYEAATEAYYVAYQMYSEAVGASSDAWTDFVNGLLSKASISVYTLLA